LVHGFGISDAVNNGIEGPLWRRAGYIPESKMSQTRRPRRLKTVALAAWYCETLGLDPEKGKLRAVAEFANVITDHSLPEHPFKSSGEGEPLTAASPS
jgi:hypothetical protein